jgi:hypothetical protein
MKKEYAFPHENNYKEKFEGMTLRDYFAAKALPILYKYWMQDYYHPDCPDHDIRMEDGRGSFDKGIMDLLADNAYELADAMLKAREA